MASVVVNTTRLMEDLRHPRVTFQLKSRSMLITRFIPEISDIPSDYASSPMRLFGLKICHLKQSIIQRIHVPMASGASWTASHHKRKLST